MAKNETLELATFGGGCFWCTEAVFQRLQGVVSVTSGYGGGNISDPSYAQVGSGMTGHAEVIQIEFDPTEIKYEDLLSVFWSTHDPTTVDRQGNDIGPQYRSVIFYHTDEQQDIAVEMKKDLEALQEFKDPIVTEILPYRNFFKAEDSHQNYYNENKDSNSYCQIVIDPKLKKLTEKYADKLTENAREEANSTLR